jgi:hypothetical protein
MINHCDRRITHLSDTDTVQSETYHDKSFIHVQYSHRHSVINHCDRCITLLSDIDISVGLFNLFTYFLVHFG